jgi:microcystin degradation protein MlrC
MRYIAVKSAVHFRSGFERLAGSIWNIDAPALHSHRFAPAVPPPRAAVSGRCQSS